MDNIVKVCPEFFNNFVLKLKFLVVVCNQCMAYPIE